MTLAEFIAQQGITQKQFAERSGMTEATVSRILNGLQSPSARNLKLIYQLTAGAVTVMDFPDLK
jgi:transcriptional regulator with XRE-family HTH domain